MWHIMRTVLWEAMKAATLTGPSLPWPHRQFGVLPPQPGQLCTLILTQCTSSNLAPLLAVTQFARALSLIRRSRATCAIDLPVSHTICTAPARNCGPN
jgi:hypothetical protein